MPYGKTRFKNRCEFSSNNKKSTFFSFYVGMAVYRATSLQLGAVEFFSRNGLTSDLVYVWVFSLRGIHDSILKWAGYRCGGMLRLLILMLYLENVQWKDTALIRMQLTLCLGSYAFGFGSVWPLCGSSAVVVFAFVDAG
jgi:hypothetical protein